MFSLEMSAEVLPMLQNTFLQKSSENLIRLGPLEEKNCDIPYTTSPFSVQVSLQSVINESLEAELSLIPVQRIIEGNKKCWLDKIL